MHIFGRDKKEDKDSARDIEAVDFFKQVTQWRAHAQPPPAQQPAPSPQPPQPATQGPPPAQLAPAPTKGSTAPQQQPVAQPQVAPAPRLKSPFEELMELAKILNLDLKPLEELRAFSQQLDQRIAELEKDASRLESEARERRRAAELLKRLREQLRGMGV